MTTNDLVIMSDISKKTFILFALVLIGFGWLLYHSGLLMLWTEDEEYGHGLMVVFLLAYLIYKNKNKLPIYRSSSQWVGVAISFAALLIYFLGEISGVLQIKMYSTWLFTIGIVVSIGGQALFRKFLVPFLIVFLLIPLPGILAPLLTAKLQLISSILGVAIVRFFGGIVYLEGNVIDMGGVKLLVAEACAGLRYLFPLMSIGAIAGYIMHAPLWMRWFIFLATIPVTIFMNSFRIAVTGLLTEAYGSGHTEGFLHFFEGWVVFIASLAILVGIAWLLVKSSSGLVPFSKIFSIELPFPDININAQNSKNKNWQTSKPVLITMFFLLSATLSTSSLFARDEVVLNKKPLSQFPQIIGEWKASESRLPPSVEAVAGASEYYFGDFISPDNKKINLYIAYYHDQKKGVAPHSPTVCIPGDGWVIESDEPISLQSKNGLSVNVSRLLITKGDKKIVTYYWLKQGKNVFYQQLMARIDLVRFSLIENRADAALIRMVSEVSAGEAMSEADARLKQIAGQLLDNISNFVPD